MTLPPLGLPCERSNFRARTKAGQAAGLPAGLGSGASLPESAARP